MLDNIKIETKSEFTMETEHCSSLMALTAKTQAARTKKNFIF